MWSRRVPRYVRRPSISNKVKSNQSIVLCFEAVHEKINGWTSPPCDNHHRPQTCPLVSKVKPAACIWHTNLIRYHHGCRNGQRHVKLKQLRRRQLHRWEHILESLSHLLVQRCWCLRPSWLHCLDRGMRAKKKAQKATVTGTPFTLECWHIEGYADSPGTAASSCIAAEYFAIEELIRQVSSPFNIGTTKL